MHSLNANTTQTITLFAVSSQQMAKDKLMQVPSELRPETGN